MITKKTTDISNSNFKDGEVILVDKPLDITSYNVVHKIRYAFGIGKIGHCGTLDPKATGLLILCTGKKTKEVSKFQELPKTYSGTFTLGSITPTMDMESEPVEQKPFENIDSKQIEKVRKEFLGEIEQIPPMYSAVKFKGKPLYKIARQGKEVKREPRKAIIHSFEISEIKLPVISFKIVCSKGTYIRVIAHDFGQKLGCGAFLSSLRRESIGEYSVDDALNLDEIENLADTLVTVSNVD